MLDYVESTTDYIDREGNAHRLGYLSVGNPKGYPVIWFHGLPSSRLEALLLDPIAKEFGLRIIGFDRPGFGMSSFIEWKSYKDYLESVKILALALNLQRPTSPTTSTLRFAVVGWSGGGPHAIATAALLPNAVSVAVVLGGCAVPFIPSSKPSVTDIMLWGLETAGALVGPYIQKRIRSIMLKMATNPEAYLATRSGKKLLKQIAKDDALKLQTPSQNRDAIMESVKEAYKRRESIKATIQELRILKHKWDIDVTKIPSGVLQIWHGIDDKNVPVENAIRNFGTIPQASIQLFRGGHSFFLDHLEELGRTLAQPTLTLPEARDYS